MAALHATGMWLFLTKERGRNVSHVEPIVRPSSAYRLQSPISNATVVLVAHRLRDKAIEFERS
jgi:hypothetical protein